MIAPEEFAKRLWQRPATKRVLALLVPILFLALASVALLHRRSSSKHILTQEESQHLAESSKSLFDGGHFSEAIEPTLQLYEAYPDNHIYMGRLAEAYGRLGKYDEEARYWERYIDHAPTPIEACPQLGRAYWKQGEKFELQAIDAYQRCLKLDPTNTDSIFYLAHALEMSGRWQEAAEQYKRGLTVSPGYTDLTLGLARCWLRLDRPEDAKNLLLPVLNKTPVSSGALLVLGMYYLHQKNYLMARKALANGAALSETDPDFHILLARVAEQSSDNEEALRQYTKVIQLNPQDAQARSRQIALQATQTAGK